MTDQSKLLIKTIVAEIRDDIKTLTEDHKAHVKALEMLLKAKIKLKEDYINIAQSMCDHPEDCTTQHSKLWEFDGSRDYWVTCTICSKTKDTKENYGRVD